MKSRAISICFAGVLKVCCYLGLLSIGIGVSYASNGPETSSSSSFDSCKVPTYAVGGKNVTNPKRSDGSIYISGIQDATHYEIIQGEGIPFDFSEATPLDSGQYRVDIRGLSNPSDDIVFKIRLYNQNETCFTDQSVHLAHILFAEDLDYTELEVIQGVDNPSPEIGDIVTFTTVVQNNGNKPASNLELKQFYSSSLELIYFYADQGEFSPIGNTWVIGDLEAGRTPKLVIRARVKDQGLSYLTSYISKANKYTLVYGQPLPTQDNSHPISATSCVTVPIQIKKNEVYRVSLQNYEGLTWYYKDAAGNFSEINDFTNPGIAEVNADSSLSIKQGGEYTYTKQVDKCTFSSCCPIIIEGCKGPAIVIDSVYCNTHVDSYSMVVHLKNDNWSIVERVYYALSNLSFPVLTNFLRRLNVLPLTSSSGFVTSLGGGYYRVENVPAFMPNVTLVSTGLRGECRTVKIVNAPNCQQAVLQQPLLVNAVEFFAPGQIMPALKVESPEKGIKTHWYSDELGLNRIGKGNSFRPDKVGKYYVAFVNKKKDTRSLLVEAEVRDLTLNTEGEFVNVSICDCKNPSMLPIGVKEEFTLAKIYPNPVKDLLNVEYMVPEATSTIDLFVFNISGKQMGSYALNVGEDMHSVNVGIWPDGLYILTMVVDGEKKLTQRFVVRH